MLDSLHDEVEVELGFAVCYLVQHDLRMDIDAGSLPDEDALEALQHLQDVDGIHATVLIVITKLEHNCQNENPVKLAHMRI